MKRENRYENIGNIGGDYDHRPRWVTPWKLFESPNLVLKMYSMVIKGESSLSNPVSDAEEFLRKEIKEGKIDPLTGLGFAILSEDTLNVARWDTKQPIVKNQIYGYENGDMKTAEPLDISDVGSFCIWELGIVNHEREAWKRYLKYRRTEAAKIRYLDDMIEGKL